jgi:putative nucleotidyltransferase with HDIG domain
VDMGSFWRHSLACGLGARALAMTQRLPKADKFFVAGLLHDIGRLALLSQAPEPAGAIFRLYEQEPMLLHEAETRVLGYDHGQIGGALLRSWNYSPDTVEAVARHHHPPSNREGSAEASVVHLADHLACAMEIGSAGERSVPPLQPQASAILHLTPEALSEAIQAIDEQFAAVEGAFLKSRFTPPLT